MNSIQFPFATQDWTLGKSRALALQATQVKSVEALSGAIWVTVSGSSQDFFVQRGDHIMIPCTHGQVVIEPLGAETLVTLACEGGELIARLPPNLPFAAGQSTGVWINMDKFHLFDSASGNVLRPA